METWLHPAGDEPRLLIWLCPGTRSSTSPQAAGGPAQKAGGIAFIRDSLATWHYHFVLSCSTPLLWNRSADSNLQQAAIQLLYLPPPSRRQIFWLPVFKKNQFSDFLEHSDSLPGKTLLMSNFNFYFENVANSNSRKLHNDMFNLTESVSEPTHNQGHLLDLVFSKQSDNILISKKLHHRLTSDHTVILCKLDVSVPIQKMETFSYWCLKKIDTGIFKQDLSHAVSQTSSISDYNNHLCSVHDRHTPLCWHTVHKRKPVPWFSSSVGWSGYGLKQECWQAERQWLKSKLTVHKQMYDSIKQKITNLVDKAK